MQELGFNYRITDFQCALGISQLAKLNKFIKKRRELAGVYNRELSRIECFDLFVEKKDVKSAWHLYPLRLKNMNKVNVNRNKLFDNLRRDGIGVQVHYIPVYFQPYYRELGYKKGLCPNAERFYQREISIPLYQDMTQKEISYVINKLIRAIRKIKGEIE